MDIYQLSALMAEQRRAERLVQADRRRQLRAAQVASRHLSARTEPAASTSRPPSPEAGPAAPIGANREAPRPGVWALVRLSHALGSRALPLSKVSSDIR
jgi:hypothetical protein